jgi:hypothetical protein
VDRFDRVGIVAGYAGALALAPYLAIKVLWVLAGTLSPARKAFDGVLPSDGGELKFILLNLVTVIMAMTGIALSLSLVRPWGMRIPSRLILFGAWIAAGFLVSILPFMILGSLLGLADEGTESRNVSMPAWEANLIQVSFGATALCLVVALPAYVRRRWPRLLARKRNAAGALPASPPRRVGLWSVLLGGATCSLWCYWAAGGSLGLGQSADGMGRLLIGVLAAWGLTATVVVAVARVRPIGAPLVGAAWVGTGALFAWCAWRLPFIAFAAAFGQPPGAGMPVPLAAFAATHVAGLMAGAGLLSTLQQSRALTIGPPSMPASTTVTDARP